LQWGQVWPKQCRRTGGYVMAVLDGTVHLLQRHFALSAKVFFGRASMPAHAAPQHGRAGRRVTAVRPAIPVGLCAFAALRVSRDSPARRWKSARIPVISCL